jgi:hypothetical protein
MLQRITDPEKVIHLVPWLVPVDQSVLDIGAEIYRRILEIPDDILILVDLDEKGICHGLLVSTLEKDCVFAWQARADSNCRTQKQALGLVGQWAAQNNRQEVHVSPATESRRRLYQRYGFVSGV